MRVLVVDDSVVFRSQIKAALSGAESVEVAGTASNGKIALQKLENESFDLVTLDMEMPELDGIATLKEIRKKDLKTRVVVFSSHTRAGSEKTLEALACGADDFVTKPSGKDVNINTAADKIRQELLPKVLQFRNVFEPKPTVKKTEPSKLKERSHLSETLIKKNLDFFRPSVVLIGSSTGGPAAVEEVLAGLEGPLRCPILIAQHMPPVFTTAFAKRIESVSGVPASEAKDGEVIQENRIYVAPGDYHMKVKKLNEKMTLMLDQGPLVHSVRPAVDHLFMSASEVYGALTMAFVLTGMGGDGGPGCGKVKDVGGGVMIQDKESCVVWGMPRAVFEAQAYDRIGNLSKIKQMIKRMAVA